MNFIALVVVLTAIGAHAANVTTTVQNLIPAVCQSDCNQWVSAVGDCITNLNANFSASLNTDDLSSWQFQGNLSALPPCLCSAEAVQASSTCLTCASTNLCITPALTMQDYSMVCQDPLKNGLELFRRYHPSTFTCNASSSTSSESSSTTPSSSSESSSTTPSSSSESSSTTPSSSSESSSTTLSSSSESSSTTPSSSSGSFSSATPTSSSSVNCGSSALSASSASRYHRTRRAF